MPTNKYKELLIRIDERVQVLPQMKQDIRDIKGSLAEHSTRIAVLEEENKNNVHIRNNGRNPLIKLLLVLLRIFSK